MTRRQSREQAFILMFEKSFRNDETMQEIITTAVENDMLKEDEFSFMLTNIAQENIDRIDERITKFSRGWSISRIPRVSLAIMRVAITEMMFVESVPVNVSINEAVELSKIYGEKNDSSFINGILGSISRDLETASKGIENV